LFCDSFGGADSVKTEANKTREMHQIKQGQTELDKTARQLARKGISRDTKIVIVSDNA
jgi:hypothetical protein